MATLNQKLKEQSKAQPEALVQVILTSPKTSSQLRAAGLDGKIKPIAGLEGVYKATLTGRQLLTLEQHPDIDSIETDEEVVALDKE